MTAKYTLPRFHHPQLLETALTHRSAVNEKAGGEKQSNERLEFLGDAVLELAATVFLFKRLPREPEGRMTGLRSSLVKTATLAQVGRDLDLAHKLYMSRGEERTGGRESDTLMANTVEAVLGALYLDQGFPAVQDFLDEVLFPQFEELYNHGWRDDKSLLQESVQLRTGETPIYELLSEEGPDHFKTFRMAVFIDGREIATGVGHSKQAAQQEAATKARAIIQANPELFPPKPIVETNVETETQDNS